MFWDTMEETERNITHLIELYLQAFTANPPYSFTCWGGFTRNMAYCTKKLP